MNRSYVSVSPRRLLATVQLHTILGVASPHVNVEIPFPRMIRSIARGEFGEKRTGIFCQRMEKAHVYTEPDKLKFTF